MIIFMIVSYITLSIVWMNAFIYADENGITFKAGFPWSKKQNDYSEIKAIYRPSKSKYENLVNTQDQESKIIFKDGFELNFDAEFGYAARRQKLRMLDYLSKRSEVPIEVVKE
jgi:hypothetical protein